MLPAPFSLPVLLALFAASVWAGAQNALAGGGSFVTLPALILTGLDPRAANVTSTVALVPGQLAAGWAGRAHATGTPGLPFRWLAGLSLLGSVLGALLLLATPASVFARMVPWLVLFATALFAWGSFRGKPDTPRAPMAAVPTGVAQLLVAVYGGYFGGGMGFVMLALLTFAGLAIRSAAATKNVLASLINLAALAIFVFSPDVAWPQALVTSVGSAIGGLAGTWMLTRVNERVLRGGIVLIGALLTVGLFWRGS